MSESRETDPEPSGLHLRSLGYMQNDELGGFWLYDMKTGHCIGGKFVPKPLPKRYRPPLLIRLRLSWLNWRIDRLMRSPSLECYVDECSAMIDEAMVLAIDPKIVARHLTQIAVKAQR